MRAYLEKKKPFIQNKKHKTNNQQSISGRGRYKQYNTVEGRQTHRREAKVTDLVGEHLQTIKKKKKEEVGSKRGRREE
jgi:hypothetical protein